MKDSRTNYVIVGAFVLLMLGGLITALAVLTGRTGPTDPYFTVYDNVGGLKFGTQVMFEGYPVGQVESIQPLRTEDGRTRFRVNMNVQSGWPIPVDSLAQVAASGLLAAVTIDIRGGEARELLPPGAEIPGRAGGSIFTVMEDVAGEVQGLTRDSVRPLLDNINKYVMALGGLAVESSPEIIENLRVMSEDMSAFSRKLNEQVLSERNVASIDGTLANAQKASAEFAAMSGELKAMSGQVNSLITTLDGLVADGREDVATALGDMRYSLDTVARHIDSITYNLDTTSRNMMEFSRSLRQNPGLLIGGTPPRDEAQPR
ncbi:MAG: MlaD family protein [Rhodospirillaceae bacterium]